MSHDPHEGPDDAVIYDGCGECDARAANPLSALLALDDVNYERLRDRMILIEHHSRSGSRSPEGYRSQNEMRLGQALYRISVLEQRHGPVIETKGGTLR